MKHLTKHQAFYSEIIIFIIILGACFYFIFYNAPRNAALPPKTAAEIKAEQLEMSRNNPTVELTAEQKKLKEAQLASPNPKVKLTAEQIKLKEAQLNQ